MRILSISQNHYVAGGMDRVMFDQARILAARGHEVIPFTAADPDDADSVWSSYFPPAPRTDGTPLRDVPATLYRKSAAAALSRLLADQRFDIVHLHSWFKRLSPAILPVLRRSGLPVVQTLHDYRSVCSRSTMLRDGRICRDCAGGRRWNALLHRCNGTLAKSVASVAEMTMADLLGYRRAVRLFLPVSEFQRDLLRDMGLPDSKMRTLPNPVAIPTISAHDTMGGGRLRVLYAGRLEDYKGAHLFADLAAHRPSLRFVMAGHGSAFEALAARRLPNLELLGQVDRASLAAMMASAACVVVPSLCPETFGLAAAEALAAQVPVVASRIGGLTEIVRDGVSGLLVQPGDLTALMAAVDALLADPARASDMGRAGQADVASRFSEDRFYAASMAIYTELLEGAETC